MRIVDRLVVGLAVLWGGCPAFVSAQEPKAVAETEARSPEAERAGFRVPEGFAVELVASEPIIGKPMNLAFDARGRLWVTSTVEYPFPTPEGKTPRDRVLILSDFSPDGKARRIETFADGLNIPIGVLPLDQGDSALVHSIPAVRRWDDTNGDGRADRAVPAYSGFAFRDTHGMTNAFTRGFDGWVYACHGFANDSTTQGSDGEVLKMNSGNIYRFRPDGSHAEYFSHGQVNPFGLAFDTLGRLYSCDCHSRPIYQNLREAYYPSFGKADDGLGFAPEMIKHDHGSTGIGGIAIDEADHFPSDYRGSVFLGNVVTGRVHRDVIRWDGSSPRAETMPDFVIGDDPWFHPVDLEMGPDGALYIADFYNRIIGHYEVPLDHPGRDRERGRIWRVVFKGKDGKNPPPADPRPEAVHAPAADLIADLGSTNFVVRQRAADLLVLRGAEVVKLLATALDTPANAWQLAHGLWVLQRLDALDDARLAQASAHPDEAVRVHAARIWGDRGSINAVGRACLVANLTDQSPHVRRAGAEALAVRPELGSIRPLLSLIAQIPAGDDHLRHVARISLRNQFRDDTAWDKISLEPGDDSRLADIAFGLTTPASARFLLGYLRQHPERSVGTQARMVQHVARFGAGDPQGDLRAALGDRLADPASKGSFLLAVAAGAAERGQAISPPLRNEAKTLVGLLLRSPDQAQNKLGFTVAEAFHLAEVGTDLDRVASDHGRNPQVRLTALSTWGRLDPSGSVPTLSRCVADAAETPEVRDGAAKVLGASGRDDARSALIQAIRTAPARLQTTIATALAATKPGAEALLAAVATGQASPRPLGERAVVVKLEACGLPDVHARLDALLKDTPPADQRVLAVIDQRRGGYHSAGGGDAERGRAIFTKNCAACHQIEGQGARVGPQLDGIGIRGLDRLLEDVLDPNRNVDQAFRVTSLGLNDGRTVAGLLLRQDGDILVVADAEGKEVRVPLGSVEDRRVAQLSPMPANFGDALEPDDFRHLMAFLLSKRPAGLDGSK